MPLRLQSTLTIKMYTDAFVKVRLLRPTLQTATVVVEPLNFTTFNHKCAALLAMCTPIDSICFVCLVNRSNNKIEI